MIRNQYVTQFLRYLFEKLEKFQSNSHRKKWFHVKAELKWYPSMQLLYPECTCFSQCIIQGITHAMHLLIEERAFIHHPTCCRFILLGVCTLSMPIICISIEYNSCPSATKYWWIRHLSSLTEPNSVTKTSKTQIYNP